MSVKAKNLYRSELLAMMRADQDLLKGEIDPAKIIALNHKNIKRIKEILRDIKLPRISILSYDGALAMWLIIQHASDNLPFQKKYLKLTNKLLKTDPDDVYKEGIAYLEDRVAVKEKHKQVYGTQFHDVRGAKVPTLKPRPIKDPKNLNNRRRLVGLPPIEDYMKDLERMYGKKVTYSY